MFDKLKQLKQLKDLESSLSKEQATVEKNGVSVTVSGKMEIKEIKLNPQLDIKEQEETAKDCINEAMKKMQMEAAKKMFHQM